MESNKDEAIKCLGIAQKHRSAGNLPSAKRFCQKSLNLFATPEGTKLLEIIKAEIAAEPSASSSSSSSSGAAGSGSAFTSSAEAHPSSSGTRHRHTESSSQKANGSANGSAKPAQEERKRDYTPEQAALVKRIRACKVTEYYEIMSLKRDCEEVEIKKAYRKVCIIRHVCATATHGSFISLPWHCTPTRMAHRGPTKLSRVRAHISSSCIHFVLMLPLSGF